MIDLRSDTVTRPNEKMRRAMAEAEVGDDVFLEDPTVNRLQSRAAQMFEREAGLFVPTGSMGNLICVLCHTRPGQEAIVEKKGHIYNYEMAALSAVGGVMPRVVEGEEGILHWEPVKHAIAPKIYYRAQAALLCLENTHNMAGGAVYPTALARQLIEGAHEAGLKVHLDGARVFNAAVALGEPVAEVTRGFDSVSFCFSKGLGAPVGSMIVGSRELIERARGWRKMLGGGMRQAGVLAAAALVALEDSPARLHEDHANARFLAEQLARMPGIRLDPAKVRTNIVIFDIAGTKMDSGQFLMKLGGEGVMAVPTGPYEVRMVTHCDVNRGQIERAVAAVGRVVA